MTRELEERAEKQFPPDWAQGIDENKPYRIGYVIGAREERARIIWMLRSEEAENRTRKAGTQFEIEKMWDTGKGWAEWLEKERDIASGLAKMNMTNLAQSRLEIEAIKEERDEARNLVGFAERKGYATREAEHKNDRMLLAQSRAENAAMRAALEKILGLSGEDSRELVLKAKRLAGPELSTSSPDALDAIRGALKFYAVGDHFEYVGNDDFAPENPSGEPSNWECGGADGSEFIFENGFIARYALAALEKWFGEEK
jgi:hypothetical protein